MRRWQRALLVAAALAPVAGLALAIGAPTGWWPSRLAGHWAPHLALLSLPALLWLGRRPAVAGGGLLLGLAALWPWLAAAHAPTAPSPPGDAHRVVVANLFYASPDHGPALAGLDGDLVALIETRPEDRDRLRDDARWPHQRWLVARGAGATALLSRWPMRAAELDLAGAPGIDAHVEIPEGPLRVVVFHAWSPVGPRRSARNAEQLAELAGLAATEPGRLLVLGDLNATPADRSLAALREAGLLPPHGGHPRTWPSWLGPGGIAIDHALGRRLELGDAAPVTLPGSDHRGVALRFR
jgi:endonuclease/exonuclease/phosphatase family metal-dependent hydrolase